MCENNLRRRKKAATESSLAKQKRLNESEMSEVSNFPTEGESDPTYTEPHTSKKALCTGRKLRSSKER